MAKGKRKVLFSRRNGKLRARIRIGGKTKETSFIDDDQGQANAEAWLRGMQDQKEKIEKGIESAFAPIQAFPFVGRFLYEKSIEVEPSTLDKYNEFFERDFLPVFKDHYLHRITTEDLKAFLLQIQEERGFSASTFNRLRQDMNTLFNAAMNRKPRHTMENPVTLLKKQIENPRKAVIFEDVKDMERFIGGSWKVNPPFWIATLIFLNAGGRISEVLALRRMDVDLVERVIHFRRSKDSKTGIVKEYTKGKRDREIPLNDPLYSALKFWFGFDKDGNPEDFLVRWKMAKNTHAWKFRANRPFSTGHYEKLHRKLLTDLKLPWVTPHGLRHTYATHSLGRDEQMDIYRIQKLLGHSDIKTTERYLHLVKDRLMKKRNLFSVGKKSIAKVRETKPARVKLRAVK